MKNASYRYIGTILTTTAEMARMYRVINRSIERWTHSALFVGASICRALDAPRFTRPLAGLLKSHMEKSTEELRIQAKA